MAKIRIERAASWYVLASIGFLIAWQVGILFEIPRRVEVVLGLYGFVLHMIFGKGYSLVPAYFDRELAHWQAPVLQFPLTAAGVLALGLDPLVELELATLGSSLWAIGVVVFVGEIAWTIRDNLTGAETGTSSANVDRQPIDRFANLFMPVAIAYLLVGSYESLAMTTPLPGIIGASLPGVTHLLAAGTGALMVFAIGFRLLPRFMVAHPPSVLVYLVLPTGAIGPLTLALTLTNPTWGPVAALIQTVAIVGFALAVWMLFRRSDRRRVGLYGVVIAAGFGVLAALIGTWMVLSPFGPNWPLVHLRINLLGFLGLAIVGVAYQFYPPAIGTLPLAGNRTAFTSIGAIAVGLLVQVMGAWLAMASVVILGVSGCLVGVVLYGYSVVAVFRER